MDLSETCAVARRQIMSLDPLFDAVDASLAAILEEMPLYTLVNLTAAFDAAEAANPERTRDEDMELSEATRDQCGDNHFLRRLGRVRWHLESLEATVGGEVSAIPPDGA